MPLRYVVHLWTTNYVHTILKHNKVNFIIPDQVYSREHLLFMARGGSVQIKNRIQSECAPLGNCKVKVLALELWSSLVPCV